MHPAYWLTPLLIAPVALVWLLYQKTSHPGLLVIAIQFSIVAAFEVLVDSSYVIFTQENLLDNPLSEAYLTQSFLATALQYNVFASVLWWLFRKQKLSALPSEWIRQKEIRFISFFVIFAGSLVLWSTFSEGLQFSYGNAVTGETLEGEAGAWGPIAFLTQIGTIYAAFCLIRGAHGDWKWKIVYFFSIVLIGIFVLKLVSGARAAIFVLAMYFLSVAALQAKPMRKYFIASALIGALMLGTFSAFSGVRITGVTLGVDEAFDLMSSGISARISEVGFMDTVAQSIRDFAWRSSGARTGAVLFADVDNNGQLGVRTVGNNIFAVIPRALWLERPFGNSSDGTASGLATYQVSQILTGSSETNFQSDSVSSASVAYWTLGWLGVMLSGAFSAWIIWYITSKGARKHHALSWLFLLGLTWGGWYVVTDIGTWLAQLSRYGVFLVAVVLALEATKPDTAKSSLLNRAARAKNA